MQEVTRAFSEVKDLYTKVVGQPAPEIDPASLAAFPPGVDPLQHALHEVHFLKQLTEQIATAPPPVHFVPRADSFVAEDAFVFRLEIPGVERDDLKVFVSGGECIVRGDLESPEKLPELRPLSMERPWGPFERRFTLPPGSNADKVSAHYREGVLELRVEADTRGIAREMKIEIA